jgi:hypothetical protein
MNEPTKTYSITYSEKEKMVLFLPDKTGTKHASFLFNHFDFSTDFFNENGEIIYRNNFVEHHHGMEILKRFETYSIICTARNPYSRLISAYHHSKKVTEYEGKSMDDFRRYFSKNVSGLQYFYKNGFFLTKTPKYFLRVENLYHDYIQIPFIRNSKLNKSGLLYELCNKKLHSNSENNMSMEEYYTQDMADYIYTKFKSYFDLLGYDKDSWKDKK